MPSLGVETFVTERGYTTVAVAVALLVSLSLVFATASVQWTTSRAAEVQEVADATAMAGANVVAAFSTIAQVVDAIALSMGLTGVIVCGVALVVAAIPVVQSYAPTILDAGKNILAARGKFARSSAKGLQSLERALPAIIMGNSASCASANSSDELSYVGMAVPFPVSSNTDFSFLEEEVATDDLDSSSEKLGDASADKGDAEDHLDSAHEAGWEADCGGATCMRTRASDLAGLSGRQNPSYASPKEWSFEYAQARAVSYYAARASQEAPANAEPDELTRSAARKAFYEYVGPLIEDATCVDNEDEVDIDLPELPHDADMVRECDLYYDACWPCTEEDGELHLHSSLDCPGAEGSYGGEASLCEIDEGHVARCEDCKMDATALGRVANLTTIADSGFERYWEDLRAAAEDCVVAKQEYDDAKGRLDDAAEEGKDVFEEAMDKLKEFESKRPDLVPAGAYGCVAVVTRKGSVESPAELASSFAESRELPAGAAVSAATLCPDDATEDNNVLSRVFDGLRGGTTPTFVDFLGCLTDLWGDLLVGYGAGFENLSSLADKFFDNVAVKLLFGEETASWLKDGISTIIRETGFEPVDMRLRKPVLVNSSQVLEKAGYARLVKVKEILADLPDTSEELIDLCMDLVESELGSGTITIAELSVPGLEGVSIPLTIDLSDLRGGS